ncbi:hypothetical protein PCO82_20870 [Pectobacteriaceae bacterium CE90]|nr:hypothetical protein PCO82_20870 [Pectobacteriaceae bacterium CE90]
MVIPTEKTACSSVEFSHAPNTEILYGPKGCETHKSHVTNNLSSSYARWISQSRSTLTPLPGSTSPTPRGSDALTKYPPPRLRRKKPFRHQPTVCIGHSHHADIEKPRLLAWQQSGVPLGMHFQTRQANDGVLLQLAAQLERALGGYFLKNARPAVQVTQ